MTLSFLTLDDCVSSANTGLDAIKRAPIVEYATDIRCLRIQDISQSKNYLDWGFTEVEPKNFEKFKLMKGDIIVARTGNTIGVNSYISENLNAVFNNGLIRLRAKEDFDSKFIYYNFRTPKYKGFIENISGGTSTQPNMQINVLLSMEIPKFELSEQQAIASVLSSLDDKIDLLHRQNKTLEAMAETLFRQWFIEGVIDTEEIITLGEMVEIFDSKRIPLSKLERDKRKTSSVLYPYYGAAKIMDYIDDFIFDGDYLLIGEDGTVQTEDGYPILQRANGKFWVNNHAHVLKAKPPFSNFFLWSMLSKTNIEKIITGAVQPKINQENLKKLDFPRFDIDKVNDFVDFSEDISSKIHAHNLQIQTLENLRDTLLPKLMSGEIRVQHQT